MTTTKMYRDNNGYIREGYEQKEFLYRLLEHKADGEISPAIITRAQSGEEDAVLCIISALVPLIYSRIKKYTSAETRNIYSEDLFSSSIVGIILAVEKYDVIRGQSTPFSYFARLKIDREILNLISELDAVCKVPRETLEAYRRSIVEEECTVQDTMSGIVRPETTTTTTNGLRLSSAAVQYIRDLTTRTSYEDLLASNNATEDNYLED